MALRLIVDREEEIKKFVPEEYWTIDASLQAPPSKKSFKAAFWGDENGKVKLTDKESTDKILAKIDGAEFRVDKVKRV